MNPEFSPHHSENQPRKMTAAEARDICVRSARERVGFRDELLRRKSEFAHVFSTAGNSTSNGSIYFVLETGEIIRSKMLYGRESNVDHARHLFISKTDTERIHAFRAEWNGSPYADDPLMKVPFVPVKTPEVGGSVIDYSDPTIFVDANFAQGLIVLDDGTPRALVIDDRRGSAGRHHSSPIREIL